MAQTKSKDDNAKLVEMVTSSAHNIWLAGLGAFVRAQAEGTKLFESLVKEGEAAQSRATKTAGTRIDALTRNTADAWNRIEKVFEDRVSKSLNKLGVPTYGDIEKLSRHVDVLNTSVQELLKSGKTGRRRAAQRDARAS